MKDEGIDAVFVTEFQITQQTGEPTVSQAGISMIQYCAGSPQDLVNTILAYHVGKRVLAIGHSNTVDDIAIGLGGSGVSELAESQFDRLFFVHRFGTVAQLYRLHCGEQTQ